MDLNDRFDYDSFFHDTFLDDSYIFKNDLVTWRILWF